MRFDSEIDDPDRFIMFYTISALGKLCASRMVLCDGTFKTVPTMFYQMYSLHGIVHEHTFPLIYMLTNTKNEAFYINMLQQLKSHAENLNVQLEPQYISSDFEIAFINAARTVFPNAVIHGCLFHFTQNLWKYAVNKGLKTNFIQIGLKLPKLWRKKRFFFCIF